jgi:peptidoglycan/LPS O-acetylase OafA/YrhL
MELTLQREVALSPPQRQSDDAQSIKIRAPKLDALTSLRFFAAAMLVVFHSAPDLYPEVHNFLRHKLLLNQGVSFFYVLSGFILTYVYPNLQGRTSIVSFLRARIARVYPVYALSFLLSLPFASLPITQFFSLGALYLLMLQDWIPLRASFWSFNPPGWSISCEFFFYLVFPLLLSRFGSTCKWKLAICSILAATMIAVGCLLPAPANPFAPSPLWFSALCPALRLWEFAIGMCTALMFMKTQVQTLPFSTSSVQCWTASEAARQSPLDRNAPTLGRPDSSAAPQAATANLGAKATFAELLAICATIAYSMFTASCIPPYIPGAIQQWLSWAGGAPIYACLIYLFAKQRGYFSRALSKPVFVLLGEISYSVYLLHAVLLNYVGSEHCASLPSVIAAPLYWTAVMSASYVCYELIEKPCRQWITSGTISSYLIAAKKVNFKMAFASAAFLGLSVGAFYSIYDPIAAPFLVHDIASRTAPAIRNTKLGEAFLLRGVDLDRGRDKSYLKLAWKALADTPLKYKVGVHIVGSDGKIIFRDFPQSHQIRMVRAGDIWVNQAPIETSILTKARCIGICLYEVVDGSVKLLNVDKGPRDCANSRLLINP